MAALVVAFSDLHAIRRVVPGGTPALVLIGSLRGRVHGVLTREAV